MASAVKAIERLIRKSQNANVNVRRNAVEALGYVGKDAVPAQIQALQNEDSQVRANAVLALEQIGTPEALKAVEEYQSRQ